MLRHMRVRRDLLQDLDKLSHKRGSYTGCNMLYGDGAVSFRQDELLSSVYSSGTVSPLWDKILFRQLLKALE